MTVSGEPVVTPLIELARQGVLEGLTWVLDAGAALNELDDRGRSAVTATTYAIQAEAVKLLVERGANPNVQDDMRNTPFLYAGIEGHLDCVKLAHAAGANPALTSWSGGTVPIPAGERG